ncbi:hypothetical protein SAY87_002765 [Trapa incisa]|uniref:Uncharacterized protein n=2 Tax=Trapa TaxID=22665 RepID=A0AAN7KAF1_TRANT|nr:hypothetical protein SAY87_002765 [Trapa incisa]KAK4765103.1 hypothetical protein SAY86_026193 [Trapa natans]
MESSRKRRGLIKTKLGLPFYKTAKPGSTNQLVSKQAMTVGYVGYQEYIISLPKPNLSVDGAVDLKATDYISSVQERFKLEMINSERSA